MLLCYFAYILLMNSKEFQIGSCLPWLVSIDFKWIFIKGMFVSWKVIFEKLFFKFSCICLLLEKLVNRKHFLVNKKHFPVKEKFGLVFRKMFSFYFGRKTLSGSCEKFRNVILFVNYIKSGPQIFDCYIYIYNIYIYIYFVLNIYFSISSLRI
jgi:hypothetical protein